MQKTGFDRVNVQKFFNVVNKAFDALAALSTALIFVIVLIQIAGRTSGHPAPWTEEGTRFVFIWMIYLGLGIGLNQLLEYFRSDAKKALRVIALTVFIIIIVAHVLSFLILSPIIPVDWAKLVHLYN